MGITGAGFCAGLPELLHPVCRSAAPAHPQAAIDKGVFSTAPSGKNPGPPNMNAVLTAAQQLASAMTYLHEVHNITHGDLTGGRTFVV